jgi:hypothetical protein
MPDLPTVAEAGVPEFKADVWFGVVAPFGTPGEIIAKLNQELVAVMRMPEVEEQLRRQGIEPMTSTPAEFAAFLRADIRKLNPAGLVPVQVDDGQVLTESRIINAYLEDAYPQPRLSPAGAYARARMRLWTRYADEVTTEAVKLPSFVKNIQPELSACRAKKRSPRSSAYPMRACARAGARRRPAALRQTT